MADEQTSKTLCDEYWRRMFAGMALQAIILTDPHQTSFNHAQYAIESADALLQKFNKE
jgi:hypothetical protein